MKCNARWVLPICGIEQTGTRPRVEEISHSELKSRNLITKVNIVAVHVVLRGLLFSYVQLKDL